MFRTCLGEQMLPCPQGETLLTAAGSAVNSRVASGSHMKGAWLSVPSSLLVSGVWHRLMFSQEEHLQCVTVSCVERGQHRIAQDVTAPHSLAMARPYAGRQAGSRFWTIHVAGCWSH